MFLTAGVSMNIGVLTQKKAEKAAVERTRQEAKSEANRTLQLPKKDAEGGGE